MSELYDFSKRRYKFCTFCKPKKVLIKDKYKEIIILFAYSDNFCSHCGQELLGFRKKTCYTKIVSRAYKSKTIVQQPTKEQLAWRYEKKL